MVDVAICICTYRRPLGLKILLDAISRITYSGELAVIVIDNDKQGEGKALVESLRESYRWKLIADMELEAGIPFARNKAVQTAMLENPKYIAMLDDDEWPVEEWLTEFLRVLNACDADLVGGPVIPVFPNDKPVPWFDVSSDYYGADQNLDDGTLCRLYASGNFLAKVDCFRSLSPSPFNPEFAVSGGEDNDFFHRIEERGFRSAWSRQGVVYETVPEERQTFKWLKERVISDSNINVLLKQRYEPGVTSGFVRGLKTVALFLLGLFMYALSFPSKLRRTRALILLWKARGRVYGHLGRFRVYGGHGG